MYLTTMFKETPDGSYKAEIHQDLIGYSVDYFKPTGEKIKTETFTGKSIHFVESAVTNWIDGIKTLNG